LPLTNNRKDIFGIDCETKIGTKFIDTVIDKIREKCGDDYPIIVKVSGGDDYKNSFKEFQFINLIRFLDGKKVSGIEISYGTMDYALNIFRGQRIPMDAALKYNPRYKIKNRLMRFFFKNLLAAIMAKKFITFSPMYNLSYAKLAKKNTDIPIICVGGFRKCEELYSVIENGLVDFVSSCRPFICEPNFAIKLKEDKNYTSACMNCNMCAIMCDSGNITKCYSGGRK